MGRTKQNLSLKQGKSPNKMIGKVIKKVEWTFDYYFVWMMYNGNKTHRYIEYMEKKYGKSKKYGSTK